MDNGQKVGNATQTDEGREHRRTGKKDVEYLPFLSTIAKSQSTRYFHNLCSKGQTIGEIIRRRK